MSATVTPSGRAALPLRHFLLALAIVIASGRVDAGDRFQISGFAWLRGTLGERDAALLEEPFSAQIQTGFDFYISPRTRAHLQLLARDGREGSAGEHIGIVEGYLETIYRPRGQRLRLRAGAFFLPSGREHIDALWETPYSVTPSALNGWLGEELRPIGIDVDYARSPFQFGATIFGGNDAFGTLPAVRGWGLRDHIALLDETITAPTGDLSRISVDTDDRPGWSGRARWNGRNGLIQYTWIDNRAGGTERGGVVPWRTRFQIISAETSIGDWTLIAESGWGPTWIPGLRQVTTSDLRTTYLLASRAISRSRLSIRAEELVVDDRDETSFTISWMWSPRDRMRIASEVTTLDGDVRVLAELRTYFVAH